MDKSYNGLDKIGSILKSMGITEDSVKEFTTVCESWYDSEKSKLQKEYKAKLDKAKKVCVEEVESHKASLSRGIQLFLESQMEKIGKIADKQAAIAESEAVTTLKKVHNILGGLDIDSAVNAQTLQAESKKNAKLKAELTSLHESLEIEKAKASKMASIADKSIARQKQLENEIGQSKKLLGEAKEQLLRKGNKVTISEHKVKRSNPKTTSKVASNIAIKESTGSDVGSVSFDIDSIAEEM